jgi:hypothetical protein
MKNTWMQRMRHAIVSKEKKFQEALEFVEAHRARTEANEGDARDPEYLRRRGYIGDIGTTREVLFCDHQECHRATADFGSESITISATTSEFHMDAIERFLHPKIRSTTVKPIVAELAA